MIVNIELSGRKGRGNVDYQILRVEGGPPSRFLTVGLLTLFDRSIEDGIDYIECDHAGAHNRAGGYGSPQHVRSGEIPDGEQRGNYGNHNAGAGDPKSQLGHDPWIEESSLHSLITSLSGSGGQNHQIGAHGAQIGDGGDAQWQPARIVSDPNSDLQAV